MLLKFSCSNHKSINKEVTYTAIAGKDNTFENELKEYGKYRVLRSTAIYGANGSGKSNFIDALSFMSALVTNSIQHQPGQGVYQAPHKLNSEKNPSTYDIQFVKNDIRYAYGFSVKEHSIDEEYLYFFPNGRQVKIFERKGMDISPGDKYKNAFELSLQALKNNRLFLSCSANYTDKEEIEAAFLFFQKDIIFYNPDVNNWTEYSIELMQRNKEIKDKFLRILEAFQTGIRDINVRVKKISMDTVEFPSDMPEPLKTMLKSSKEASEIVAKIAYDKFETDLLTEESTGIKKLFEIICPIIDIINTGKLLVFDEIENGLHEAVVYEIVRLFKYAEKEQFAQLLFSTHDTSLLNMNLFRRDQVWFTQLDKERATDLYSLVEVKNVRKTENLEKGYMLGKYGAIPMLSHNIYDIFNGNG
ncbi:MAG: ATP-binding protein [Blautia sp.]|nr:ATP-binding protein [Blautia sp.]